MLALIKEFAWTFLQVLFWSLAVVAVAWLIVSVLMWGAMMFSLMPEVFKVIGVFLLFVVFTTLWIMKIKRFDRRDGFK